MNKKIVLASRNKKKVKELSEILSKYGVEVVPVSGFPDVEDVEETGSTFAENAELKAVAVMKATGLPALADDSGLEVDALDGAPGIYSARFAGENADDAKNNSLLLEKLNGLEGQKRSARFRCVIAFAVPEKDIVFLEGNCEGQILNEYRGSEGFGYDPLFYCPELGKTFAQSSAEEKNRVSHRGRALVKFSEKIKDLL
jgi:XTP/dITP diphosphohydrolase